jgi:proline dehydrogenase
MGLARQGLLAISDSAWLRVHAPRWWFVRKAATRFMPGDTFDEALAAARSLSTHGLGVVFTELGENVADAASADRVVRHYTEVLDRIQHAGVDGQISVKLTQLGLDVDPARCYANVRTLVEHAGRQNAHMWIDMEQHAYLDRTLTIYRQLLAEFSHVGVCLQAYLYRTRDDLQSLLALGGSIRLVKGAYREPADIAFPKKRDVDINYLALADQMLASAVSSRSPRMVFGTHDESILSAIASRAGTTHVPPGAFEFHLLFGIQTALQQQLARDGRRVRVLISYGDQWFAWYMRRLAERPANVLFAVRAMLS